MGTQDLTNYTREYYLRDQTFARQDFFRRAPGGGTVFVKQPTTDVTLPQD